jgi:carboxyl-terminal processing protease
MRGNPGGFLNSAVDVSGNWLKTDQLILQEKRGGVVIKSFTAPKDGILVGIPTAVLVDEGSASASEITAGALKDNNAATIIGTKTFGKGSVQEFSTLRTGDVLKVTIARWFTPSGQNIDKEGIEPNIKVDLDEEQAKAGNDNQLESARLFIVNK